MDRMMAEIDALKARWMTGGAAAGLGPPDWQGMDDLALLALAGQFTRIATRPAVPGGVTHRPDIPELPLMPLPDDLRPLFRRLLESKAAEAGDVVRLIAARGHCVNPIDWMPKRNARSLPSIYEPWRDWLECNLPEGEGDALTPETWDQFAPSQRHRELTAMHHRDAPAARALIAELAPTLAADQRLRLLQCLRAGLTDGDSNLLEEFLTDRSSKVQGFVKTQLARLGRETGSDTGAASEATDFLDVARSGILSRRKVVMARKLKTDAQRNRRRDVFARLSLVAASARLGLAPDEMVEMWDMGDATEAVARLVAATGTDGQADRFAERAVADGADVPPELLDRLDPARRTILGVQVLARDDWTLAATRPWFPTPEGGVDGAAIKASKGLPELVARAAAAETPVETQQVAASLAFLGLIADRAAATALLDMLTAAGVMAVDPRLTLLRLNAAL